MTGAVARSLFVACTSIILVSEVRAAQRSVPELHGQITAKNYRLFEKFVSENLNKVVGLQISVDHSDSLNERLQANTSGNQLVVYLSSAPDEPSESEIVANTGFAFQHASYVFDGFFVVKSGGMHQGVVSYGLVQADEAAIKLNLNLAIKRRTLPR